jgi:two-component system NarL family response regulator
MPDLPGIDTAAEIEEVVSSFATEAQRMLPHDRLSIYLLTSDGTALERFAVASSPPIPGEKDIQPLEDVGLARVIRTNEQILSADFATDERILGEHDSVVARAGFHAIVSVPLRHRGRPFGLLNFVSRASGAYTEREIVVAQQIADQVAAFVRDLRLQQTIRDSLRRDAVRHERERVAREFHDTLAQSLAEISVRAETLSDALRAGDAAGSDEAARLHAIAHSALQEVKRSIFDPVPAELRGQSLSSAIRLLADRLRGDADVSPTLEISGEIEALPFEVKATVLRVLQESLANIRKHARASAVAVALRVGAGEASLLVEDDGCGFAPDGAAGDGFGTRTMRERAEQVGGGLEIRSSVGGPTAVELRVPLAREGDDRPRSAARVVPLDDPGYPPPIAIRILIADDHPLFRHGISELIGDEPGMRVVGEVGSGQECLGAAELLHPDLVLLDLSLPDMSGVEVASRLRQAPNPPTVLVMSAFTDGSAVAEALDAGARGYVGKSTGGAELVDAIRSTVRGATVLNASDWAGIASGGVELTRRELQVLELLASGHTNAEVAGELHLATKTVEHIVARIVSKLGARNRTHAVAIGIQSGLVAAPRDRSRPAAAGRSR